MIGLICAGTFNRARYSNPTVDALLREAVATFDPARREALLQQAAHAAFSDYELDSLTLAELMFAIDDELHVIVPDSAFAEIRTLAQLATVVDGLRSQGLPAQA